MSVAELYKLFVGSTGVCTDTRSIKEGNVFFALKGPTFNGNQFAEKAILAGCSYAIVDEDVESKLQDRIIQVDDVLFTLQGLATYHRRNFKGLVIALTGSNGKTTSKELLASVLSAKFRVSFTSGNLNNHIGVPLTLLKVNLEDEFAIIEMGANHQGEIDFLCNIAEPDFGLIVNIGKAHLEGFGGIEGVKKGKTEMYRFISTNAGKVFFNEDEPSLAEFRSTLKDPICYGGNSRIRLISSSIIEKKLKVELSINDESVEIYSNLFGAYNANNMLTAAAIGSYFGVPVEVIKSSLEAYYPANNRSQLLSTKAGNEVVLDAYNANPTSMKNAINEFQTICQGKGVMILGEMRELGDESQFLHQEIIGIFDPSTEVYLVGEIYSSCSVSSQVRSFGNVNELCDYLTENPIRNRKVLLKGSRGVGLENVLPFI